MPTGSRRAQDSVVLLPDLLGTIEGEWSPHFESIKHYQLQPNGIDWPYQSSDFQSDSFHLHNLVEHTYQRLESLGLERVVLWGYGLGGYVALEIERTNPGFIEGIWMHATKFFWNEKDVNKFRNELSVDTISPRRKEFMMKQFGDRWIEILHMNSVFFDDVLENGLTVDDLLDVRIPVLVTAGDQDEWITSSEVEKLADSLSGGEWQILNGVRHHLHSTRSSLIIPTAVEFTRRVLGYT
ncbi:MAG: alpha/beta hydrolase [bacterium]|nr:alpha/beta hydrolase [bacterium]